MRQFRKGVRDNFRDVFSVKLGESIVPDTFLYIGQRAAAIMSLLATAKANGLDPYAWLTDVLTRLPTTLDKDLDSLLPTSWYCPIG